MSINKDSIKAQISRGNLSKALEQLETLAKDRDGDFQNTLILLKSRFLRLQSDERIGILTFDNAAQTRNRITHALLSLIDEIEDAPVAVDNVANDGGANDKSILFVAANPKDSEPLRIGEEFAKIKKSLDWSENGKQFTVEQEWASGVKDLRRALLKIKPNIVHFSGHGSPEGGILLEDDGGYGSSINIEGLGNLFALFKDSIQCVLLNSCYSEPQAMEISKHIPIVIGTKENIPDDTSIAFSEAFYEALGSSRSIEDSFQFACNNIQLNNLTDEDIPVLITKDK